MKTIYVGNLPFGTTESDIESLFAQHGKVEKVQIIKDKFTGESRGFGFVHMEDDGEAATAIQGLDGAKFQGRNLKVNEARPMQPRTGGGGGGGGGGGRSRGGPRGSR